MYTCDICGVDQVDTENLLRVIILPNEEPHFYDNADLLICSDCWEEFEYSGLYELVTEE